jgi:hypothetical protein
MSPRLAFAVVVTALLGQPSGVFAQPFEALGTRAAGMAGAFVAVADDASAVYWNPAALASGGFFGLVLDQNFGEGIVPGEIRGNSRSGTLLALGTPPLGLSYYRLQATGVEPSTLRLVSASPGTNGSSTGTASRLVTHHVGVTLVQSLTDGIAVGTTLKFVHGTAAVGPVSANNLEDLLEAGDDLPASGTNAFDADIGVIATMGQFRAGVTIRNVAEPEFETGDAETSLQLDRLTRAGVAYAAGVLLVAGDIDLERVSSDLGDARTLALGAEVKLLPKAFVRSGFSFNTLGDQPGGHAPIVSFGGSYAVLASLLVDVQVTTGSEAGARGWGIAGRVVF